MNQYQELINNYIEWFKDKIKLKEIDNFLTIQTPFLDTNNDHIVIYIEQNDDDIILSDDGYYINNLEQNGIILNKKRNEMISKICYQYGIAQVGDELCIKTKKNVYPKAMHNLLQGIIAIDDLSNMTMNKITNFFHDEIVNLFSKNEIYYSEGVQFIGKSTYSHNFDFLFQRSKYTPERLCKIINNPTKTNMATTIFSWEDIKDNRKESELFVILNDNRNFTSSILEGFNNYNIKCYLWSKKNEIINFLKLG